jgi:hypothetical protein
MCANGKVQPIVDLEGAERRFVPEPVTIRETTVYGSISWALALGNISLKNKIPSRIFWLVPLPQEGSRIAVSVLDGYPVKSWDRSSDRFIWATDSGFLSEQTLHHEVTMVAGVARISLAIESEATRARSQLEHDRVQVGAAVVAFGLTLHPSPHIPSQPWCIVVEDDGVSDLASYFSNPALRWDTQQQTSLSLDVGIVVHGEIVTTNVSGGLCQLIKLWAVESVAGGKVTWPRRATS